MPENLPVEEDIKKLARRIISKNKKALKDTDEVKKGILE